MVIWEYIPDSDNFVSLSFVNDATHKLGLFTGMSLKEKWKKEDVIGIDGEKRLGHFYSITSTVPPIATKHAVDLLISLINESVELLPLRWIGYETLELYALNVIEIVDCLDSEQSVFAYYPDGRVMYVRHHVLKENFSSNKHIFMLPQSIGQKIYLSNEFKRVVEENYLLGLKFRPLP